MSYVGSNERESTCHVLIDLSEEAAQVEEVVALPDGRNLHLRAKGQVLFQLRLRQEGHLLRIALDRARHDHRVDAAVTMVAGRAAEDRKEHVLVRMRGTDAAHPTASHEWRVVELQLDTGATHVSQRLGAVRLDARVQHVTLGRQGHLPRLECGR